MTLGRRKEGRDDNGMLVAPADLNLCITMLRPVVLLDGRMGCAAIAASWYSTAKSDLREDVWVEARALRLLNAHVVLGGDGLNIRKLGDNLFASADRQYLAVMDGKVDRESVRVGSVLTYGADDHAPGRLVKDRFRSTRTDNFIDSGVGCGGNTALTACVRHLCRAQVGGGALGI